MSFAVQKYTGAVTRLALPRINAAKASGAWFVPFMRKLFKQSFSTKQSPRRPRQRRGVREKMTQTK
jgi:hypothetical protein